MENIKRETLYGDPSVGGIGLVCIKLKLRASLIMHIVRLLTYICSEVGTFRSIIHRFCI